MKFKKRLWIPAVLMLILVVARVWLPILVKDTINQRIDAMPRFSGYVEDVDLHLYRGAYEIEALHLELVDTNGSRPFVNVAELDISVRWSGLFRGRLIGEVYVKRPEMFFSRKIKQEASAIRKAKWPQELQRLLPIHINHLVVENGALHYRDPVAEPEADLTIDSLDGTARNISNRYQGEERLPSPFEISGVVHGADVEISGALHPLEPLRNFAIDARLSPIDLTQLNDFARAYANLDLESGTLEMIFEADADDGHLDGYIKPLADSVNIFTWKGDVQADNDGPIRAVWEGMADVLTELFENQSESQFATRVEFSGQIGDADTDQWSTLVGVFRNAFVEAFEPQFD